MAINTETKVLVGVLVATVAIIVGGAFWAARTPQDKGRVATDESRLVRADDPVQGAAQAKVTVVEFSDFECPACGQVAPALKTLQETFADKSVRFVFRQYPLAELHKDAELAAEPTINQLNSENWKIIVLM